MLFEIYKGVEIFHNASKDEFYTRIVINKREGKSDQVLQNPRLGRLHEELDKFLNTAAKKPAVKKGWLKDSNGQYSEVEILLFNTISKEIQYRNKDGKIQSTAIIPRWSTDPRIFIRSKENDAIVALLNKKEAEIAKIKKETSCSAGKLIQMQELEHFI